MVFGHGTKMVVCTAVAILLLRGRAMGQTITDLSNGVLTANIPFGNLTPGTTTTPSSAQVLFKIRSSNINGYRVRASATFSATENSPVDGGSTISASDIGIGVTFLSNGASVQTPRIERVATGFNYNPATVTAVNGLTPYTGMASGRATLADVIANPNMTILSGPRISNNPSPTHPTNFITVTITFGLVGQFFTPSTLSGVVTLTIVDGP